MLQPTVTTVGQRPNPPCHVTDPRESLLTTSPSLIQRCTLNCLASTGPLSYTWRGSNRPPNRLPDHGNRLTFMQLPSRGHPSPLDGEAVEWTVTRRPSTSPDSQVTPNRLTFAYKYPMPSTHYKRGCGCHIPKFLFWVVNRNTK